jgi:hypothetical protein
MTDISRHSSGVWRSFFVMNYPNENMYKIEEYLVNNKIMYSYCNYTKNPGEDDHRSFRVNFDTTRDLTLFRNFLKKGKFNYFEKNYDEEYNLKLAYCAGTRAANNVRSFLEEANMPVSQNQFMRLAIHGMLNNLHYTKGEEMELIMYMFKGYMIEMGFNV